MVQTKDSTEKDRWFKPRIAKRSIDFLNQGYYREGSMVQTKDSTKKDRWFKPRIVKRRIDG